MAIPPFGLLWYKCIVTNAANLILLVHNLTIIFVSRMNGTMT